MTVDCALNLINKQLVIIHLCACFILYFSENEERLGRPHAVPACLLGITCLYAHLCIYNSCSMSFSLDAARPLLPTLKEGGWIKKSGDRPVADSASCVWRGSVYIHT